MIDATGEVLVAASATMICVAFIAIKQLFRR